MKRERERLVHDGGGEVEGENRRRNREGKKGMGPLGFLFYFVWIWSLIKVPAKFQWTVFAPRNHRASCTRSTFPTWHLLVRPFWYPRPSGSHQFFRPLIPQDLPWISINLWLKICFSFFYFCCFVRILQQLKKRSFKILLLLYCDNKERQRIFLRSF